MSLQLIPISYLKEECFLSDNIDERKYRPCIDDAQEDLKQILGVEFYDQIVTQYGTNPKTLSADNLALYDGYLKKYLAWQTYMYFLGFANSESTPTGERSFIDENSTVLEDVKMWSKEKNVKNRVDRWRGRIINFLREAQANDSTKYSLWDDCVKEQFSFGMTAITGRDTTNFRINKSITTNE
jgi:hypothetical protein